MTRRQCQWLIYIGAFGGCLMPYALLPFYVRNTPWNPWLWSIAVAEVLFIALFLFGHWYPCKD